MNSEFSAGNIIDNLHDVDLTIQFWQSGPSARSLIANEIWYIKDPKALLQYFAFSQEIL